MTQVAIIDTKLRKLLPFNSEKSNLSDAFEAAGLKQGEVDFGSIGVNYSIIVYEFGLLKGKEDEYFRLGTQLFNGNAILFKIDDKGETIDIPSLALKHMNKRPEVQFFPDINSVEQAIEWRLVVRPSSKINGETVWEWNR